MPEVSVRAWQRTQRHSVTSLKTCFVILFVFLMEAKSNVGVRNWVPSVSWCDPLCSVLHASCLHKAHPASWSNGVFMWRYPICMSDSVVGMATRYGLVGDRIPVGAKFCNPSRLALGPTQSPIEWVPGVFPVVEVAGAWLRPPTPHLASRLKKE
jgi:hypothetical protein